jgi:hypothetical protein
MDHLGINYKPNSFPFLQSRGIATNPFCQYPPCIFDRKRGFWILLHTIENIIGAIRGLNRFGAIQTLRNPKNAG